MYFTRASEKVKKIYSFLPRIKKTHTHTQRESPLGESILDWAFRPNGGGS